MDNGLKKSSPSAAPKQQPFFKAELVPSTNDQASQTTDMSAEPSLKEVMLALVEELSLSNNIKLLEMQKEQLLLAKFDVDAQLDQEHFENTIRPSMFL